MKTIYLYIVREYTKIFFITLITFLGLFAIINYFEKMEMLSRYQASFADSIEYIVLRLPSIAIEVIPFSALLSSLVLLGMMKNKNELTALRCSGAGISHMLIPLAFVGVMLSILEFYLNENIVPLSNRRVKFIERVKIKKENPFQSLQNNEIWFRDESSFYRIDLYLPEKMVANGIIIFTFDENFNLLKRVDAKEISWVQKKWLAKEKVTRIFYENKSTYSYEKEGIINLPYTPDELKNEEVKPDEMNFYQLRKYLKKMKFYGHHLPAYSTDLYYKISFPLGVLIVTLIGIPISLRRSGRQGMGANILIALTLGFLYWLIGALSRIAGGNGILSPLLAAWIPDIVFVAICAYLLIKTEW
jgi:lipopolysaccharide export system permease protein